MKSSGGFALPQIIQFLTKDYLKNQVGTTWTFTLSYLKYIEYSS